MLENIFAEVVRVSFFTGVLTAGLLLAGPLLKKRYKARWRVVVWMLLAVRLLLPFPLSLPFAAPVNVSVSVENLPAARAAQAVWVEMPAAAAPVPAASPRVHYVWLGGVLIFLLVHAAAQRHFYRRLRTARCQDVPKEVKEIFGPLDVMITEAVDAPMLVGFFRPRVLLPHAEYSREDLAFIFRHELIHYKRGDMFCKLLLFAANALHWFNPMVYLLNKRAASDIELACDEYVVEDLGADARERYGNTLLNALPASRRRGFVVGSTNFGNGKREMKDRLRNLFDDSRKRRGVVALCLLAVVVVVATGTVEARYTVERRSSVVIFAEYEKWGLTLEGLYPNADGSFTANSRQNVFYHGQLIRGFSDFGHGVAMSISSYERGEDIWIHVVRGGDGEIILLRNEALLLDSQQETEWLPHPEIEGGYISACRRFASIPNNIADRYARYAPLPVNSPAPLEPDVNNRGYAWTPSSWSYSYSTTCEAPEPTSFSFHITHVENGKIFMVKRLDFEPGQVFDLSVVAEEGEGVFVGITDSPHLASANGQHVWTPLIVGNKMNFPVSNFDGNARYLYIGSVREDLHNVTATLQIHPQG